MARSGVWGGRTAAERSHERRTRMIAEAIAIWSEDGWSGVSMRRVCADAAVNDRYFYEEFKDREGLLAAAWDSVRDDVLTTLAEAYSTWSAHESWEDITRNVTRVLLDWMTANPTRARMLLSRDEGTPALAAHHEEAFRRAIDLLVEVARPRLPTAIDEARLSMAAIWGVGGFIELLRARQSRPSSVDDNDLVEFTAQTAARFWIT